nr:protein heat-stress-associated 32 [Tanacetum cinerariifolium]
VDYSGDQDSEDEIESVDNKMTSYLASKPSGVRYGDIDVLIRRVERCLKAGADMISIDPEGICRFAESVRSDIIAKVIGCLGLEKTMFEASNSKTSEWFIK